MYVCWYNYGLPHPSAGPTALQTTPTVSAIPQATPAPSPADLLLPVPTSASAAAVAAAAQQSIITPLAVSRKVGSLTWENYYFERCDMLVFESINGVCCVKSMVCVVRLC